MFPKKIYKKRKPSLASRGKFSKRTIEDIVVRDNGLCVLCYAAAIDIHHVIFKSKGGRGVFTNGVCLCRDCHDRAHSEQSVRYLLEDMMIEKYGVNYFKDSYDD